MTMIEPGPQTNLTTEHIKSHLQKFRQSYGKTTEEFVDYYAQHFKASYEDFLWEEEGGGAHARPNAGKPKRKRDSRGRPSSPSLKPPNIADTLLSAVSAADNTESRKGGDRGDFGTRDATSSTSAEESEAPDQDPEVPTAEQAATAKASAEMMLYRGIVANILEHEEELASLQRMESTLIEQHIESQSSLHRLLQSQMVAAHIEISPATTTLSAFGGCGGATDDNNGMNGGGGGGDGGSAGSGGPQPNNKRAAAGRLFSMGDEGSSNSMEDAGGLAGSFDMRAGGGSQPKKKRTQTSSSESALYNRGADVDGQLPSEPAGNGASSLGGLAGVGSSVGSSSSMCGGLCGGLGGGNSNRFAWAGSANSLGSLGFSMPHSGSCSFDTGPSPNGSGGGGTAASGGGYTGFSASGSVGDDTLPAVQSALLGPNSGAGGTNKRSLVAIAARRQEQQQQAVAVATVQGAYVLGTIAPRLDPLPTVSTANFFLGGDGSFGSLGASFVSVGRDGSVGGSGGGPLPPKFCLDASPQAPVMARGQSWGLMQQVTGDKPTGGSVGFNAVLSSLVGGGGGMRNPAVALEATARHQPQVDPHENHQRRQKQLAELQQQQRGLQTDQFRIHEQLQQQRQQQDLLQQQATAATILTLQRGESN